MFVGVLPPWLRVFMNCFLSTYSTHVNQNAFYRCNKGAEGAIAKQRHVRSLVLTEQVAHKTLVDVRLESIYRFSLYATVNA